MCSSQAVSESAEPIYGYITVAKGVAWRHVQLGRVRIGGYIYGYITVVEGVAKDVLDFNAW